MGFWNKRPTDKADPFNVVGGRYCGETWENGTSDGQECWPKSKGASRYVYRWCADVRRWVEVTLYRGQEQARCEGK